MAIETTTTQLQHWNYFLMLEEDVGRLSRYVEPSNDNLKTYSIELARLLFAAASEVDVVSKMLCKQIDSKSKAKNIDAYRREIKEKYPQIAKSEVSIKKYGLNLLPWDNWGLDEPQEEKGTAQWQEFEEKKNPAWWRAYNNVKHSRNTHFTEATLKNGLNAVAGLFSLLLFYYKEEAEAGNLTPDPNLFTIGYPFTINRMHYSPHSLKYELLSAFLKV